MPAAFDRCVADGGRVRRISGPNKQMGLGENEWVNVCFDGDGNMHRGEVQKKKSASRRDMIPADRLSPEPEWRALHRVADRHRGLLARIFREDAERARGLIPELELVSALERGDVTLVETAVGFENRTRFAELVEPELRKVTSGGARAAGRVAKRRFGTELSFRQVNPFSAIAAQNQAARLVTQVNAQTRVAVRETIAAAFSESIPPRESARLLMDVVGLDSRRAAAVRNFRVGLIEDGVSGEVLERRVSRYARKQLRFRARAIARTETIQAAHLGQDALWRASGSAGLLDLGSVTRTWVLTPDDRLDETICAPMSGQMVEFEQLFITGVGTRVRTSPAHVMCRCSVVLEV